jgi:hypothetical protein
MVADWTSRYKLRGNLTVFLDCLTLNIQAQQSFEMSEKTRQMTEVQL